MFVCFMILIKTKSLSHIVLWTSHHPSRHPMTPPKTLPVHIISHSTPRSVPISRPYSPLRCSLQHGFLFIPYNPWIASPKFPRLAPNASPLASTRLSTPHLLSTTLGPCSLRICAQTPPRRTLLQAIYRPLPVTCALSGARHKQLGAPCCRPPFFPTSQSPSHTSPWLSRISATIIRIALPVLTHPHSRSTVEPPRRPRPPAGPNHHQINHPVRLSMFT